MDYTIVSGNLNLYGNSGYFETDRSTWGFSDSSSTITRSSVQKYAGLYSALVAKPSLSNTLLIPYRFSGSVGKFYLVRARVYVPSSQPIGPDTDTLTFTISLDHLLFGLTEVERVDKTVLEAEDNWQEISIIFEATGVPLGSYYEGYLRFAGTGAINGTLYVDNLEVFEIVEDEEEPAVCDVEINTGTTTVINETSEGAADGSIEVEATGTGTLEYSKDGGETWQLSNLFTGLTTGIYIIRVRQQANPTCYDEYPFAVNFSAVTHDFTASVTNESFAGLEDGAISVTVTGTGGPFEFSNDGGETWQAGNSFTGLAPGDYYVAVRNDAGNSVVKVITVAAGSAEVDKTYFHKNPITLAVVAPSGWDVLDNFRMYADVRVEDVADSGTYNSKLKVELPPDTDGNVEFYLQQAFRGVFTLVPPTLNHNAIIRLTDRIKRFKNFTGQLEEDEITPATLTPSSINLVLWGGISKFHYPDMNFFGAYLTANKKFMTWAPLEKVVGRTQEDYLNFYCYGNFTQLKLQLKVYFDDDTDETEIVSTITSAYTNLYQVPAGPANCGVLLVNPLKNVTHYELTLLNQADEVVSETRTYYLDLTGHPLTRYFMFLNSLGSFEVLRFTGVATAKTEYNRQVIQKFLPANYAALDGEFKTHSVSMQPRISYGSGYVNSHWHEYLKDFLLSPMVFDVTDGPRVPVNIVAGEHDEEDQRYDKFIRFEVRPAYNDTSFTPKTV